MLQTAASLWLHEQRSPQGLHFIVLIGTELTWAVEWEKEDRGSMEVHPGHAAELPQRHSFVK